jgi:predicted phage tail protein
MRKIEYIEMEKAHPFMNDQKYVYRIFGGDGSRRDVYIHDWATLSPVDIISCGPAGDGNIYVMVWNAVVDHLRELTKEAGFSEFEVFHPEKEKWVKFIV